MINLKPYINKVRRSVNILGFALIASYIIGVMVRYFVSRPSGHFFERLLHSLQIFPCHPKNPWVVAALIGFLGLWGANWFYFWFKVRKFLIEPRLPQQFIQASLFVTALLGIVMLALRFDHKDLSSLLMNPVISVYVWPGAFYFVTYTMPVFIGVNLLLALAGRLGWERLDPVKSKLNQTGPWAYKGTPAHDVYSKLAAEKGWTYLGYEISKKEPVYLKIEDRNKHIQVLGSTGSGKTRFTLFPMMAQDIKAGRGLVFIDAKGSSDNAKVIFNMVKEAHREKDFVFFSLTDVKHSGTYNPLQHGNASQLKDKIAASIDWSEPFYQRICESALQTLFMDLEEAGKRITLKELFECLKNPPDYLMNFKELADMNQMNIKTLISEVNLLVNTPFGHLLSSKNPDINLWNIYKEQKIVYFALDTQSYQHTAMRLGKMITQDLNTLSGLIESQLSEEEKKPLVVTIDEFQAFGTRGFLNALARGRASGFWITIAHQSLGDLKAIDDAFAQQVIENTNTKVFLRVNDPDTAQLFSDSVGTKKSVETTGQVLIQGSEPKNYMGSQKVIQEYIIHPTELKNLTTGQAVFKTGQSYGRLSLSGVFPKGLEKIELPVYPSSKVSPPTANELTTKEPEHVTAIL